MKKLVLAILALVYFSSNTWASEQTPQSWDEVFIVSGETVTVMIQVPAASGAKYEAVDDPETILWNKGAAVTLEIAGAIYPNYNVWQHLGRIWLPSPNQ